jgi:hypothetical protein
MLVEVFGGWCFAYCSLLSSVLFKSGSRLSWIEENAFTETGLIDTIPASVEFIGDECFRGYSELQSIAFERGSRLRQIGRNAFFGSSVSPILSIRKCDVV